MKDKIRVPWWYWVIAIPGAALAILLIISSIEMIIQTKDYP